MQVASHSAWGSEFSLDTNKARAMDVISNSFCAAGGVLGNGTWMNVGGNQAVTTFGATAASQTGGTAPYSDWDGGKSYVLRLSLLSLFLTTIFLFQRPVRCQTNNDPFFSFSDISHIGSSTHAPPTITAIGLTILNCT